MSDELWSRSATDLARAIARGEGSRASDRADRDGTFVAAWRAGTSFEPTTGQLNDNGRLDVYKGQTAIVSQEGPIARTVADFEFGITIATGGSHPPRVGRNGTGAAGLPRSPDIAITECLRSSSFSVWISECNARDETH